MSSVRHVPNTPTRWTLFRDRLWRRGVAAGSLSALAVGIPSDVIANPWFTRMTPIQWWSYPILLATAVLTATWAALPSEGSSKAGRVSGASLLGALSVGCPICNKVVVALLGVSGAFALWAPLQPVLGMGSVAMVAIAALARWRSSSRLCALPNGQCAPASEAGRPRRDRPATSWGDVNTEDTTLARLPIGASSLCYQRGDMDLGIGSSGRVETSSSEGFSRIAE